MTVILTKVREKATTELNCKYYNDNYNSSSNNNKNKNKNYKK